MRRLYSMIQPILGYTQTQTEAPTDWIVDCLLSNLDHNSYVYKGCIRYEGWPKCDDIVSNMGIFVPSPFFIRKAFIEWGFLRLPWQWWAYQAGRNLRMTSQYCFYASWVNYIAAHFPSLCWCNPSINIEIAKLIHRCLVTVNSETITGTRFR